MRSYRPCRARPQPPSGCNGQCAKLAERQSSRVTYSSPASPVSNRSCTGTGPAGMPPARAHLLKAQRQVGELTQSRRRRTHSGRPRTQAAATGHRRITPKARPRPSAKPQAVDMWTMRWRAPARPVDNVGTRCPPPVPSPTCPPPPTTVRSKKPIQRQCHCALRHRQRASPGHALRHARCGES